MTVGALQRVIRGVGRRNATERCDLCGEAIAGSHRHLLDTDSGAVMCACHPCTLLFVRDAAGNGRYRQVPSRRRRLAPIPTGSLGVPVGLAFFMARQDGVVLAHYPSPAGPTRWEVDPQAWRDLVARHVELRELHTEVEALLVNTARGRQDHWLVPVDDCFRLVALVRREWRGLSGGSTVWPALGRFFDELTEQP